MQFVLATRHLERIAITREHPPQDIIFWVRGLTFRHGARPDGAHEQSADTEPAPSRAKESTDGGCQRYGEFTRPHRDVTPGVRHSPRLIFT